MKIAILITAVGLGLSACSSTPPVASHAEKAKAIQVFEAVCLKTAPSFVDAEPAALTQGFAKLSGDPSWKLGFNQDKSLGVQIKPNTECVITSPTQRNSALTQQFLDVVSRHTNTPVQKRVPSKVNVNGVAFIFQHDRSGGEAFVMLKVGN
jgi:hypothetical protein